MRILHTVEYYNPSVGGAQEVVRQISERLVARGHEVTVATSHDPKRTMRTLAGVRIEEFAVHGSAVRGFEGEIDRYQRFLREGPFDVMLNYAAQQWATDLALTILDELPYARVLAPCGFSGLFLPDYESYFESLPAALAGYESIVLHSSTYRDAAFLRKYGIDGTRVISNGAAAEEFDGLSTTAFREAHTIPAHVPLLLSVGSHTGMKGHDLVLDAFARINARDAVLVLVGNTRGHSGCLPDCRRRARRIALRSLRHKRVLLLDVPRDEVLQAYAAADVFVLGSRVEAAPLVLFEAAASATPFITLPVGNAEEIAAITGGGVVVPGVIDASGFVNADASELAAAIDALLEHPDRRSELAAAGHHVWQERFRWDQIALQYEEEYRNAIAERTAPSVQSTA